MFESHEIFMCYTKKISEKREEIIIEFIILLDWSKEEQRIEMMFDLSLMIGKFKSVKEGMRGWIEDKLIF